VLLMQDLGRLDERVRKLQQHFLQANKDVDDILTSSGKVSRRGAKIEALEFGEEPADNDRDADALSKPARAAQSKTGHLRLRVVDGDEG
jgi:DNA recombination protein RmuC